MTLTSKELSAIEDQLSGEQLLVTKLRAYSQSCTDPVLKGQCESIAQQHQKHYDKLLSFLN
ncbi:Spore coat protein [Ruminococcaceae bacterium BL-6]|jgi:hypothetical protein|nr:Spore coat protein [Ruminococcaceae bacterium BL-6]